MGVGGGERVEPRVVPKNSLREHQTVRIGVSAVEEGMAVFCGPGCGYSVGCGVRPGLQGNTCLRIIRSRRQGI